MTSTEQPTTATADARYDFSDCRYCGQRWQNIDFGCAHHHLVCDHVLQPDARAADPTFKRGGKPLCGAKRTHMSLAVEDFRTDPRQCKRCAAKLAAMDARAPS